MNRPWQDIVAALAERGKEEEVGALPPVPPVKQKRASPTGPCGPKMNVPMDRSIVVAVLEAMTTHQNIEIASKALGIHRDSTSLIFKLARLRDRNLPMEVKDKIQEALEIIETTRQVAKAKRIGYGIIKEYWSRSIQQSVERKSQKRLDATLLHIRESCASTLDMEVPLGLSDRDIREAIVCLSTSIEQIARLIQQLSGESHEESY